MTNLIRDDKWMRQSFLVRRRSLEPIDQNNSTFTSATLKYTDTAPGGSFAINPPPQFTRTADIRAKNPVYNRTLPGNELLGLGRYYSEAIDDNAQLIHMSFGVPQFNSLTQFFTGFYSGQASQLARTGRSSGLFYQVGKAAALVVSVLTFQLIAIQLLGVVYKVLAGKPSSKFYYFKETMPLYWNAVTTIVNHLSVNSGIVPRIGDAEQDRYTGAAGDNAGDSAWGAGGANQILHNLRPDIFSASGGIDVYAIANRAQRLVRARDRALNEALNAAGPNQSFEEVVRGIYSAEFKQIDYVGRNKTLTEYLSSWFNNNKGANKASDKDGVSSGVETGDRSREANPSNTSNLNALQAFNDGTDPYDGGFLKYLEANLDDGSQFATFRVNYTGPVNESFSSSTAESELSRKINSLSSSSRSSRFSFADGNIGGGPFGAAVGKVLEAGGNVLKGAADFFEISGLAALGGSAFVDIPKHWQSSVAQLPRSNYTVHLVSPYGNDLSQLVNLHLPLAMLLAAALPLSTGKQSYTSPFLCQIFDQGRCQTRLGIIDSMSVTRGTGNLGFNNRGKAMGIDITFSVADLSSVLHMPISEGVGVSTAIGAAAAAAVSNAPAADTAVGGAAQAVAATVLGAYFDDDSVFSDYMATLSGMSLPDQLYPTRRAKLNLTRQARQWESWFSNSHASSWLAGTPPGRLISAVYRGTDRR